MEKEYIKKYIEARIKDGSLAKKLSEVASILKHKEGKDPQSCS